MQCPVRMLKIGDVVSTPDPRTVQKIIRLDGSGGGSPSFISLHCRTAVAVSLTFTDGHEAIAHPEQVAEVMRG